MVRYVEIERIWNRIATFWYWIGFAPILNDDISVEPNNIPYSVETKKMFLVFCVVLRLLINSIARPRSVKNLLDAFHDQITKIALSHPLKVSIPIRSLRSSHAILSRITTLSPTIPTQLLQTLCSNVALFRRGFQAPLILTCGRCFLSVYVFTYRTRRDGKRMRVMGWIWLQRKGRRLTIS